VEDYKTQPREAQYTAASQSQPDTNSTPSDAAADDWASVPLMTMIGTLMKTLTSNVSSQKMSALQPMKSAANPRAAPDLVRFTPYSYREPKSSGVETESVYDADYRVLTPPHKKQIQLDELGI